MSTNFKSSRSLEQFFLTLGQNNFKNCEKASTNFGSYFRKYIASKIEVIKTYHKYKLLFKYDIHNRKKDHFEIHILMIFEATVPCPKDR